MRNKEYVAVENFTLILSPETKQIQKEARKDTSKRTG